MKTGKSITLMIVFLLFSTFSYAIIDPIGTFKYTQPNGSTFEAYEFRDEFGKYCMYNNSYVVIGADSYYYYGILQEDFSVLPGSIKVGVDDSSKAEQLNQLININSKNSQIYQRIKRYGDSSEFKGVAKTATLDPPPTTLVVILVEFENDVQHLNPVDWPNPSYSGSKADYNEYTIDEFNDMLFQATGAYTHADGLTTYGSMRKFYRDVSGYPNTGYYDITGQVANEYDPVTRIPVWITVPHTKNYYNTAANVTTFTNDVLSAAADAGIDISRSASRVIAIIYAGNMYKGRLMPQAVPSSHLYIINERFKYYSGTGTEFNDALFANMGVHAHEFGHLLGWGDYYGTNSINQWGLMSEGANNPSSTNFTRGQCPAPPNPALRILRDWLSPTTISSPVNDQSISFDSNYEDTDVFKVCATNTYGSPNSQEYLLIENRQIGSTGPDWNRYPSISSSEDGILIWHVKESGDSRQIDLIEADNVNNLNDEDSDAFRIGENTLLTDFTSPNCRLFSSSTAASSILIKDISSSGSIMTADISPYWAGDLYDNVTWSGVQTIIIGDDFRIPENKTLQVTSSMVVNIKNNKSIEVEGTLRVYNVTDDQTRFQKVDGGSYWSGIILNGGTLDVDCGFYITNAIIGLTFYENNGLDTSAGKRLRIEYCQDYGVWIHAAYPQLEKIRIYNCGSADIMITDSSSDPTIGYTTMINSSDVGMMLNNGVDATLTHSNVESVNSHRIYLNGTGIGLDMSYNNLDFNSTSGQLAIYNASNWIDSTVNYFGSDGTYDSGDEECPLSVIFSDTTKVVNWWYRSLSHITNGAPAKIVSTEFAENPFIQAHEVEFSGNINRALELYRDIVASSDNPYYRRKAIKSIIRINENNSLPYTELRNIIANELKSVDAWEGKYLSEYPWYKPSLNYLLIELYVREAKQKTGISREQLLRNAISEFESTSAKFVGNYMEVEILSRIANIYGSMLNDPITAKQYADRAAQINPGQPILRSAYYSANEYYNPCDYENIYATNQSSNFKSEPPIEPQTEQVVENSVSVFPNPANPVSNISYSIAEPSHVKLDIYSITGQKVAALVDDYRDAGLHTAIFDGSNLASGLYLYRFQSNSFRTTGRLMIIK